MSEGRYNLQQGMDIERSSHAVPDFDEDIETSLLPIAVPSDGDSDELGHREPMYRDKSWAIAFKINVVLTVVSAVWFGTMGVEALMADSLTNAGRRRLHLGESGDHGEFRTNVNSCSYPRRPKYSRGALGIELILFPLLLCKTK